MRKLMPIYLTLAVVMAYPRPVWAQVPEPASVPRLAVPARQPVPAAGPIAQTPGQPTTATPAAAPTEAAPVTAVTGAPVGVTPVGAAPASTASSSQAATADQRSHTAGKFGLTLEGVQIGWLRSVEGGSATADVIVEKPGPDQMAAKHIARVEYERIALVTDLQSKALNDWIAASWKGNATRKSGSIQGADYNNTVVSEREFSNALLVETTMPALDAGNKDAAHLTVKLAPDYTRLKSGSGAKMQGAPDSKAQKKWLPSNFRFEMAGLDGSRVNKIDSFTVRLTAADNPAGESRDYRRDRGAIEFPNLRVTFSTSSAQTWLAWHEDFVVKGNSGSEQERNGVIVYLDPTMKTELGRVNLSSCGIFRLTPEKVVTGSESISRMIAELYCERMDFVVNAAK